MLVLSRLSRYYYYLKLPAPFPFLSLARLNLSLPLSSHSYAKQNLGAIGKPSTISSGWDVNNRNINIKTSQFSCTGKVKEATKLFDEMSQPDPVSCASMITVFLRNHDLPKAEALFRAMPESQRNIVAESAMIDGYVKAGRVDEARKVFDEIYEGNVYSWTSLISGYFKARQVDEGRRLFDRMPLKLKNVVSWTTVVLGCAHNGLIAKLVIYLTRWLREMSLLGRPRSSLTLTIIKSMKPLNSSLKCLRGTYIHGTL